MSILVKEWFYKDVQIKAQKYNWTLVWERAEAEVVNLLYPNVNEDCFFLVGKKIKETEKAIEFSLDYWDLNKSGRYVTDAPKKNGFKCWIPKSVIVNLNVLKD